MVKTTSTYKHSQRQEAVWKFITVYSKPQTQGPRLVCLVATLNNENQCADRLVQHTESRPKTSPRQEVESHQLIEF